MLSSATDSDKEMTRHFKQTSKWIIDTLTFLESESTVRIEGAANGDLVIVKALALEALASLSNESLNSSCESSVIKTVVLQARPSAERLLFSESTSIWAIRGIASLVEVLGKVNHPLNDKRDEVFDILVANLRSQSHFLRLHTLQILASYPEKTFVTDHADLDFNDDLDEEPSHQTSEQASSKGGPMGLCDIVKRMLKLESTPVRLANERTILGLVSRIEVLGRMGKLPVIYTEAASNHMLGLLYVKFAPMWPAAGRSLITFSAGHEDIVWPILETKLVAVMQRLPNMPNGKDEVSDKSNIVSCQDHHLACIHWQDSCGTDISIFQSPDDALENGILPSHLTTDEETVMESVWNVAEQLQQLLAKHSRVVVPVFISFLHNQYYCYHSNDPETRELHLHEHVDSERYDFQTLINQMTIPFCANLFLLTSSTV
jgi:hypothetical protein